MNSLPPELLLSIIGIAADCSSTYESYRARLRTLSALTLVDRQFHQIAQPLLPQQLYFRNSDDERAFTRRCSFQKVQKVASEVLSHWQNPNPQSRDFAKLNELRIQNSALAGLAGLSNHKPDEIVSRGVSTLSPSTLPLSVSLLFDLDPRNIAITRGRSSLASDSSLNHSHLRIRLPCEPISSNADIKSSLEFAHKLVKESTTLEELYLDLYPQDGRRGFVLGKELEEEEKKLAEIAREKKVEIIWENHEADWCRSRVSKELWRRCKAKKEKERHRRQG
ncbi:hypothetical protein JCM5350_005494 [Sporobolomyces pararoseus]